MKRILIITDNLLDQINGVVTTFKNLEIIANNDGCTFVYIHPGLFNYIDAPGYPEVKLSLPWNIGKRIQEADADHIHIATEGPLGFAARCWLDRRGWKYNTSYHTKFPEFMKKIYHIPESWTYWYVRWFHKHSGRVLTTTQTMVNELQEHGFRSDIIPWTRGVDRNIFKSSLRHDYSEVGKIYLLNVGRVSKEKGLDDFCNINIPGAVKIIIGDGPYRPELEKRYPDVQFLGSKTGKELATYFANADVFVFPSVNDTFGVVIIESLAVGTPVAAYPVPGPIDILEQDVTGYMHTNLQTAVQEALKLDRQVVEKQSQHWTWTNCWTIFKENLIEIF
jgi:glycosyltransferase involved in cell wall biosynthesis